MPRAREHAPHAKIWIFLADTLSSACARGGQPTGTTASAVLLRIKPTASPSKKIWTEWPASASASPCRKGNAALVGSSDPHALFIMMLRGFLLPGDAGACAPDAESKLANAISGNAANCERNDRRDMEHPVIVRRRGPPNITPGTNTFLHNLLTCDHLGFG